MFCSKCGKQIPDESVFCSFCGAQLAASAQQTTTTPTTKEGWMLLAIQDAIRAGMKDPDSAKFDGFENIEIDGYGRTYAEIVVRAKNSYGAYVPSRYAAGFYDVTDSAPCTIIPKSLAILPGIMVGTQRKVVKSMIKFGTPR